MNVSGSSLLRQDTLVQESRARSMQVEEQPAKDIMMKALKDVSGLENRPTALLRFYRRQN